MSLTTLEFSNSNKKIASFASKNNCKHPASNPPDISSMVRTSSNPESSSEVCILQVNQDYCYKVTWSLAIPKSFYCQFVVLLETLPCAYNKQTEFKTYAANNMVRARVRVKKKSFSLLLDPYISLL